MTPREEQHRRISETLRRQLGEFHRHLSDPRVIEILLNPDGKVWVERLGEPMTQAGSMNVATAESLISTVASTLRATVTRENPILECELPLDGSRFEALLPPVVSAPVFSIRRPASVVFTLDDYQNSKIMTVRQRLAIEQAVADRRNILVVGGTSTGKTTLVNAIIDEITVARPDDRIVIIEDTSEVQCKARNAVKLRTCDGADMPRLVRATMRLRPDCIIVGEVRGGEALALVKAWNTGHSGGVATVHANSVRAGLTRLEQLIGEVSQHPMREVIAQAVQVIVAIAKAQNPAGRVVTDVATVEGFANGDYVINSLEF